MRAVVAILRASDARSCCPVCTPFIYGRRILAGFPPPLRRGNPLLHTSCCCMHVPRDILLCGNSVAWLASYSTPPYPTLPCRSSPRRGDRDRDNRDRDRDHRDRGKQDRAPAKDSKGKDQDASKPTKDKPKAAAAGGGGVDLLSKLAAINARVTGKPAVAVRVAPCFCLPGTGPGGLSGARVPWSLCLDIC